MFENIINFFKRFGKNEKENSKNTAKERLHLVLAQDRANISADFLEMMKQEIIDVIKKYIDIDEEAIDVRMTNKPGEDGTVGAPALYANIPIVTIKNEARKLEGKVIEEKEIEKQPLTEEKNKEETLEKNNEEKDEQKETIEEKSEDKNQKENESVVEENKQNEEQTNNENIKNEKENTEVKPNVNQKQKGKNYSNKKNKNKKKKGKRG